MSAALKIKEINKGDVIITRHLPWNMCEDMEKALLPEAARLAPEGAWMVSVEVRVSCMIVDNKK